jgi:hypothetical protein
MTFFAPTGANTRTPAMSPPRLENTTFRQVRQPLWRLVAKVGSFSLFKPRRTGKTGTIIIGPANVLGPGRAMNCARAEMAGAMQCRTN